MTVEVAKNTTMPEAKSGNSTISAASTPEIAPTSLFVEVEKESINSHDKNMPITPPDSEGKAPRRFTGAPAKVAAAKSSSAPIKSSQEDTTKTKATKSAKDDRAQADVDKTKARKGNAKVNSGSSNARPAGVQTGSAQSAPSKIEVKVDGAFDPAVYSTQIFDIFIGPSKAHFMAHEAILVQSPLLAHLIEKQVGKKGKLKTTLVLPRESPANFGALLQYLYSHQLVMPSLNGEGSLNCDTDGEEAKAAAKLLAKLYVLAHNYEMNGMEERIIGVLELTGLMEKIPGLEFFELAEKLYPDDAEDVEDDEFAKHFNKVAPELIRTVPDKDLPQLMRMVSAGGAYAEAIFLSYNTAVKMGAGFSTGAKVKREEIEDEGQEHLENDRDSKRARVESVETEDL